MNFRRRQARRELPTIDLTPMIDVVFQLVLFLVLTTTFQKNPKTHDGEGEKSPGIQVDLPRSSAQTILSEKKDIHVWISSDGATFVNEQPVDRAELRKRLRAAARADATTLVVIKADKGVSHGQVVGVMDVARDEGLSRLAIATAGTSGAAPE